MRVNDVINALHDLHSEYVENMRIKDEKIKELNETIIKQGRWIEHYKMKTRNEDIK